MTSPPTKLRTVKISTTPLLSAVGQQSGEWHRILFLAPCQPSFSFRPQATHQKGSCLMVSTKGFASKLTSAGLVQRLGIWRSYALCRSIRDNGWLLKCRSIGKETLDWIVFLRHFLFGNATSRKKSCGMLFTLIYRAVSSCCASTDISLCFSANEQLSA